MSDETTVMRRTNMRRWTAYTEARRQEARNESSDRVRRILDTGRWPTGVSLAPYEAALLRRNCADILLPDR